MGTILWVVNDQKKERYMENVEDYQQLPEISACKKCCYFQRDKVSWF